MINTGTALPSPRRRSGRSARAWPSVVGSPRARLLLADVQVLVLEGLRRLLEDEFEVVGCAHDVAGLERDARALVPDLVVVGAGALEGGGLRRLERLRSLAPSAGVLVLAARPDPQLAADAFRLGARGFVVQSSPADELRAALAAVRRGERFLTPLVAAGDVDALLERVGTGGASLTPREREVVRLTAEGKVMKEVGAQLGITARTVAFHKYRAMDKVGARSSADLVRFALCTMGHAGPGER